MYQPVTFDKSVCIEINYVIKYKSIPSSAEKKEKDILILCAGNQSI